MIAERGRPPGQQPGATPPQWGWRRSGARLGGILLIRCSKGTALWFGNGIQNGWWPS